MIPKGMTIQEMTLLRDYNQSTGIRGTNRLRLDYQNVETSQPRERGHNINIHQIGQSVILDRLYAIYKDLNTEMDEVTLKDKLKALIQLIKTRNGSRSRIDDYTKWNVYDGYEPVKLKHVRAMVLEHAIDTFSYLDHDKVTSYINQEFLKHFDVKNEEQLERQSDD